MDVLPTSSCMQQITLPLNHSSGCRASNVYSSHPGHEDRIRFFLTHTCFYLIVIYYDE
nr:MAG TPA: hypothetical protein [Caudoviricetes sp.]